MFDLSPLCEQEMDIVRLALSNRSRASLRRPQSAIGVGDMSRWGIAPVKVSIQTTAQRSTLARHTFKI